MSRERTQVWTSASVIARPPSSLRSSAQPDGSRAGTSAPSSRRQAPWHLERDCSVPWRLGAMAPLEFLAGPAPARVVAADLLDRGDATLLDDRRGLLGVLLATGRGRLGQRAGLRGAAAARIGDAAAARGRAGRRVLLRGSVAVLALDLDLNV